MVFPVYSPKVFDKAIQCILSALHGTVTPSEIIVVDNSGGEFALYYRGHDKTKLNNLPRIEIVTFQRGIGLTGAWNYALRRFRPIMRELDLILLPGDDCVFHSATTESLLTTASQDLQGRIFYPAQITDPKDLTMSPWSFFAQRLCTVDEIGYYDEDFAVYFADNDYAYRMQLAGMPLERVVRACETTAGHWGSATYQEAKRAKEETLTQFTSVFQYCEELYIAKWGGKPKHETYLIPYNGMDKQPIRQALWQKYGLTNDR